MPERAATNEAPVRARRGRDLHIPRMSQLMHGHLEENQRYVIKSKAHPSESIFDNSSNLDLSTSRRVPARKHQHNCSSSQVAISHRQRYTSRLFSKGSRDSDTNLSREAEKRIMDTKARRTLKNLALNISSANFELSVHDDNTLTSNREASTQ